MSLLFRKYKTEIWDLDQAKNRHKDHQKLFKIENNYPFSPYIFIQPLKYFDAAGKTIAPKMLGWVMNLLTKY
jgi:hypothetical protein